MKFKFEIDSPSQIQFAVRCHALLWLLLFPVFSANSQQVFTNFQAASAVVGQPNFASQDFVTSQTSTFGPTAVAISAAGKMAVADSLNNRVLLWNSVPTNSGTPADVVVGKPDFTSYSPGTTASLIKAVHGVAFSPNGQKLIVSDSSNNRVLIWNTVPTVNGMPADLVIGQTNFTTKTSGRAANKFDFPSQVMVTPSGKLLITDQGNDRVLIFNSIPTSNGASAAVVIGQANMTTNTSGSGANRMVSPGGCALAADGKLLVADGYNHRVLIFNTLPTTNGASANGVIGQTAFGMNTEGTTASRLNYPAGVAVSPSGQLAIGDFDNSRVLIYNTIPSMNGAEADSVLGQPNFTTGTFFTQGVSSQSMANASQPTFTTDGRLLVSGLNMHRVMIFGNPTLPEPEIVVEWSGIEFTSGMVLDLSVFPTTVGHPTDDETFTIRNLGPGTLSLNGSSRVSVTGPDAGHFIVSSQPASSIAVNSTTTFAVNFAPNTSGYKTASLSIENNDSDENPYQILLYGRALSLADDTDGDGLNDASEFNMSALGFDWQVSQSALVADYYGNANGAGLFTPAQVQALQTGTPLISRDSSTGRFKLTMDWKKSTNLTDFYDFPAPAGSTTSISPTGDIEFEFSLPDNAAFLRLQVE